MLEEATTLLARKQETESKQQLLKAFNEHFLLSDEDLTTLTSSAEAVNDQYFVILARVKQIHKDCEILLGYENQRLGLELMEQTTRNLDAGYKKLYNWIQREFKGLDLEDPHISGSIRRSLRALSERPTLFQNCLDFFGEARQVTLSEAFQTALTDSTLGASKAIEFSTHDPLRYVGDMLAWVHSTTVSEKEALEGLFISDADEISRGLTAGKSSEPWARLRRTSSMVNDEDISDEEDEDEDETATTFHGHAALNSLISRNMASVSQILSQRISLTIRNLSDQITIYKCYNLLLFYQDIFIKLLGLTNLNAQTPQQPQSKSEPHAQNSLLLALSNLQSQALNHFQGTVSEDIEAHSSTIDPKPTLQPPGILQSNLALFSSILHVRAPNLTNSELTKLYGMLLAPVIELCANAASSPTPQDESDETQEPENFEATIYRLNYMQLIISTLTTLSRDSTLNPFIAAPLHSAEQEVENLSDRLADNLTAEFLSISQVQELLDITTTLTEKTITEKRKTLLERLEDASATLDSFLASALMDAQDHLSKLGNKAIGKSVVADAVERFCEEFEKLVGRFEEMDGEFEGDRGRNSDVEDGGVDGEEEEPLFLREVYPRTVAEVKALLS